MNYVADFETTVDPNDCRVWAAAIVQIGTEDVEYFNTIDGFMSSLKPGSKIYFHNLKFDGEFILNWLYRNKYSWSEKKSKQETLPKNTFTTLISDTNVWYTMDVNINGGEVHFIDSLKIVPFSVDKMAQGFGLPIAKLKIDYKAYRAPGHELTFWEKEYIKHDVLIVAKVLKTMFDQGMTHITAGSNAFNDFKKIFGKKKFDQKFPKPDYDSDVRSAYRGGFTWLNPKYQGKVIGKGIVLDVNSLYPDCMYNRPLPYGEGVAFKGKYKFDPMYPLYVQMIRCDFELKPNHIPTIQIKNSLDYVQNEYLTSSDGKSPVMVLTNIDLKLLFDHYDVSDDIEYMGGWMFMAHKGNFTDYIDKWMEIKSQADIDGNKEMRQLAKLMLNSLYGKFGVNPNGSISIPELVEGRITYAHKEKQQKKVVYLPVACFVTAWARYKTITSAQKCYDRIIYCDTDSLHLKGTNIPEGLEVHPTKLGAWKHESNFTKAKFLRQKCYLEMINGKIQVKCAGMPKSCHHLVTFDNFQIGAVYEGKLRPTHQPGGVVLKDTTFKIKPNFHFTI